MQCKGRAYHHEYLRHRRLPVFFSVCLGKLVIVWKSRSRQAIQLNYVVRTRNWQWCEYRRWEMEDASHCRFENYPNGLQGGHLHSKKRWILFRIATRLLTSIRGIYNSMALFCSMCSNAGIPCLNYFAHDALHNRVRTKRITNATFVLLLRHRRCRPSQMAFGSWK